jgi:hypothetical protein
LAASDVEGGLYVWDIPSKKMVYQLAQTKTEYRWVRAFRPDGKVIVLTTMPREEGRPVRDPDPADLPQPRVRLVELASGKEVETLVCPNGFLVNAAFTPDGKYLAVGATGGVLLFDMSSKAGAAGR